jgi:chloramphenicol-sensitive protein RarD
MAARAKFESDTLVGAAYALGAFAWWSLDPIYFKAVGAAPVLEVLAQRAAVAAI